MCSMFLPRSSNRTRSPFSVSSLAAHPPEIPDPTTIASYVVDCTAASALFVVDQKVHQKLVERDRLAHTATVSVAVSPLATLPVIVASSSEAPSLNTMSDESETCERFVTLASYP